MNFEIKWNSPAENGEFILQCRVIMGKKKRKKKAHCKSLHNLPQFNDLNLVQRLRAKRWWFFFFFDDCACNVLWSVHCCSCLNCAPILHQGTTAVTLSLDTTPIFDSLCQPLHLILSQPPSSSFSPASKTSRTAQTSVQWRGSYVAAFPNQSSFFFLFLFFFCS